MHLGQPSSENGPLLDQFGARVQRTTLPWRFGEGVPVLGLSVSDSSTAFHELCDYDRHLSRGPPTRADVRPS